MLRHAFVIAIALIGASALAAQTNTVRAAAHEPGMWESFNWGIHSITIPAVFLLGLVAGWLLRERKLAEERAREEISKQKAGIKEP